MVIPEEVATRPELSEITERIVNALNPVRVYLFGSYARGDASSDSDYDLLVIMPSNVTIDGSMIDAAYDSLWGISASVDVIVWTLDRFDERSHLRASLPGTVLREGTVLYERV